MCNPFCPIIKDDLQRWSYLGPTFTKEDRDGRRISKCMEKGFEDMGGWWWVEIGSRVCSGGDSQQNYEFQVLTLLSGVQSTHVVPKLEHLENLLPVLLRPYCSKNRWDHHQLIFQNPQVLRSYCSAHSQLQHHHIGPCPTFAGRLPASPSQLLFPCVCPLRLVRLTRNYPEISREGISWWTKADLLSLEKIFTQSQAAWF